MRYATELDRGIIADDGTSGTHLGILNTSSIVAVTYTDATPTPSEAWGPLWDLQQQIESGVYKAATHLVMHPRRWAFFCSAIGTNQAMFGFSGVGVQLIGQEQSKAYGAGVRGILAGLPVIVDANITTTDSSTRDIILGVTADELFLWGTTRQPVADSRRADQCGEPFRQACGLRILSVYRWPLPRRARQDHRLGSDNANIRHRSQLIAWLVRTPGLTRRAF